MFGKILLPVRTKSAVKKSEPGRPVGYTDAVHIGIIFRYLDETHFSRVIDFVKLLESDNKGVAMLAFVPKKEPGADYKFPNYSVDNLSAWGKLTSEEIDLFLSRKFDFLINLDLEPHSFVDNVLSRASAKCKIGHYKAQREVFYQLMIHVDPSDDFELFLDKVYYYIKKIRADV